jgi:hypothetical protein
MSSCQGRGSLLILLYCCGLQALPSREDVDSKGEANIVWLLQGVEAGSKVSGLTLCCLDEVGRPAETRIKGKLQVRQQIRVPLTS